MTEQPYRESDEVWAEKLRRDCKAEDDRIRAQTEGRWTLKEIVDFYALFRKDDKPFDGEYEFLN